MKETALSLKEQLAGSRAGWYRRVRAERQAIIRRHRAPATVLANAKGETLDVGTLLKKGPVIIIFYRGLYCNLELKAFPEILPETAAARASLVAISPEKPDDTLSTAEKNALTFEVPNDVGQRVGRALGLVYDFTDELKTPTGGSAWRSRLEMVRGANGRFPSRPPMSSIKMARPFTPTRMSTIAIVLIPATSSRP
jgi:peroxiredoxin